MKHSNHRTPAKAERESEVPFADSMQNEESGNNSMPEWTEPGCSISHGILGEKVEPVSLHPIYLAS